jgi:hypothetical protein
MRTKLIAGLASTSFLLAGAFVAGGAYAKKSPAPEAADQTLGMAIMAADVDYNAADLFKSSGVVSAEKLQTGRYRLQFARAIDDCYIVATPYLAGVGSAYAMSWLQSGTSVDIMTYSDTNISHDSSFHVIAFCPK